MPAATLDWTAIRASYEQQGISQNTLSKLHGVSQQAISKRARKEQWIARLVVSDVVSDVVNRIMEVVSTTTDDPKNVSTLATAQTVAMKLAQMAQDALSPIELKLIMDSLSQCHKIILTSPQQDTHTPHDMREFLSFCTDEELAMIRPLVAEVEKRRAEATGNIRPIRKIG